MAYERKVWSFGVLPVPFESFAHIARCKGRPDSPVSPIGPARKGVLTLSAGREPQPLRSVLSMPPPLTHRGLHAALDINNDKMRCAMGMRLGNPHARNWFCRNAKCPKWHDWPA